MQLRAERPGVLAGRPQYERWRPGWVQQRARREPTRWRGGAARLQYHRRNASERLLGWLRLLYGVGKRLRVRWKSRHSAHVYGWDVEYDPLGGKVRAV